MISCHFKSAGAVYFLSRKRTAPREAACEGVRDDLRLTAAVASPDSGLAKDNRPAPTVGGRRLRVLGTWGSPGVGDAEG